MGIKLTSAAIRSMRGQTDLFHEITDEFGLNNIETIRRWMRVNKVNGPLTSKSALSIISRKLNVPEENLLETFYHETNCKGSKSAEPVSTG
jgi:hypothetical protein